MKIDRINTQSRTSVVLWTGKNKLLKQIPRHKEAYVSRTHTHIHTHTRLVYKIFSLHRERQTEDAETKTRLIHGFSLITVGHTLLSKARPRALVFTLVWWTRARFSARDVVATTSVASSRRPVPASPRLRHLVERATSENARASDDAKTAKETRFARWDWQREQRRSLTFRSHVVVVVVVDARTPPETKNKENSEQRAGEGKACI